MDNQKTKTQQFGSLGVFFPQPQPLKKPEKKDLEGLKFKGSRTDLQVYHLAYGTKKLRACTYRRMQKRQDRLNKKKAQRLVVRSPEQITLKAEKQAWLNQVEQIIKKNNLQTPTNRRVAIRRIKKGNRKSNKKRTRKIKQKIAAAVTKETQMVD